MHMGGGALRIWPLLGFLWERQGRVSRSGLAGVNDLGRLWALGMVSSCLVPALGRCRQRTLPPGVYRPGRGGRAPDLLVCISGQHFAVSKNGLALGEAVSLQPERFSFFKMSKCRNIQ